MHYVYILKLRAKTGKITYYTGYTTDIDRRIEEHQQGTTKSTRGRKIVRLEYLEMGYDKSFALKREREIKKLSPKEKRALGKTMHRIGESKE
jgi:putative endonuclease